MHRTLTFMMICSLLAAACFGASGPVLAQDEAASDAPVSDDSLQCIACHEGLHPGIVEGWRKSRHARRTPAQGRQVDELARRVSSPDIPENLMNNAVGCAECHTMRPDAHADTFEHGGFQVHIVVSPDDCATCHSEEREQYKDNLMSEAHGNLENNSLYQQFALAVNGHMSRNKDGAVQFTDSGSQTYAESCLYCHGTRLSVNGTKTYETDYGTFEIPVSDGWPNQGAGRINLDGSKGSCTGCHTRHQFSIAEARSPSTCKECHNGPDVPAYRVYSASKHGTIYEAKRDGWNFEAVPWVVGQDF
ncbi:MAG: multiheme c-type cytochrome, partial [Oceanidesulfovibrio sp.]